VDECGLFSKVKSYARFWIRFTEQGASNWVAQLRFTGAVICGFKSVLKYVVKYRLIVINFRVFGSVVLSAKCGGQSSFCLAMPSPTLRPREQADHARYRSFVVSRCGFGL